MNSFEEFLKAQNKSLFIHQYKCKCSKKYWWGSNSNNICKRCKKVNVYLDLKKMIGIGWFECKCGRKYAGFSRGDVSSKCHICQDENYPSFIVPGFYYLSFILIFSLLIFILK